jgi:hypothetical protein
MAWLRRVSHGDGQSARALVRQHTPISDPPPDALGKDIPSGKCLERFALRAVRTGIQKAGRPGNRSAEPVAQRVMSICTGSAMDAVSCHLLNQAFAQEEVSVKLEVVCQCDIVKEKCQNC